VYDTNQRYSFWRSTPVYRPEDLWTGWGEKEGVVADTLAYKSRQVAISLAGHKEVENSQRNEKFPPRAVAGTYVLVPIMLRSKIPGFKFRKYEIQRRERLLQDPF
jgi:hypothetical protein